MLDLKDIHYPAIYTQLARDFIQQNIKIPGVELSLDYVFKLVKIPISKIEDPHSKFDGKQIEIMLSLGRLLANKKTPFSFQLVELFKDDTLGIFGLALINSETARDALEVFLKYTHLYFPGFEFIVEEQADALEITLKPLVQFDEDVEKTLMEMHFASFSYYLNKMQLTKNPIYHLPFKQEFDLAIYQKMLGSELYFDQPLAKIIFPEKSLDEKISRANLAMQKIYLEQLEQQLAQDNSRKSFADIAQKVLQQHAKRGHFLTRQQLADELACSERTLTRKLKVHNQSFQHMLDEIRSNIAKDLLKNTDKSNQQIALKVGINNPAVFCRSFKNWTGKTPGEYRQGLN